MVALAASVGPPAVWEEIENRTGHRGWVQAIVVYWSAFPQEMVDDGRCVFLHGDRLQAWMCDRPAVLAPGKVEEIAAAIATMETGTALRSAPGSLV